MRVHMASYWQPVAKHSRSITPAWHMKGMMMGLECVCFHLSRQHSVIYNTQTRLYQRGSHCLIAVLLQAQYGFSRYWSCCCYSLCPIAMGSPCASLPFMRGLVVEWAFVETSSHLSASPLTHFYTQWHCICLLMCR